MDFGLIRKEAGERGGNHGFGGARRAILAFQRNGDALFRNGGAEHAFGAGLGEDPTGRRLHQPGAGAACPCDVEGFGHAGIEQAFRGAGADRLQAGSGRHSGKAMGEPVQGHGIGRDRAAVDAAIVLSQRGSGQRFHDAADFLLDGMIVADIALGIGSRVAGGTDEA